MSTHSRLDAELVRRGLARSRGHARELIAAGLVAVAGHVAHKPATPVGPDADLTVRDAGPAWVSRAAYKLVGALEEFGPQGLTVAGKRCLDVGASTGGSPGPAAPRLVTSSPSMSDATSSPDLAGDPRVTERSQTTVRGLEPGDIGGRVDLLVADLSFISLTLVLGTFRTLLRDTGDAVVLVKPQFEVGRTRLGKGGIVRDQGDRAWAITEVAREAIEVGLHPRALAPSPIQGGEGNAEYLLWLTPVQPVRWGGRLW